MNNRRKQKTVVYYDETKDVPGKNLKGHILFFVPESISIETISPLLGDNVAVFEPRNILYKKIQESREKHSCKRKLHFCGLTGKQRVDQDHAYFEIMSFLLDSIRHRNTKHFPIPLNCKIGVIYFPKKVDFSYYDKDNKKESEVRYVETLLRILLKGSAHFLYDEDNVIEITKIIIDGLPLNREFDKDRVIHRLHYEDLFGRTQLRDHVIINDNSYVKHLDSNHKSYPIGSEDYIDANMLQAADLLLGAVTRCFFPNIPSDDKKTKKDELASLIQAVCEKSQRGSGFRNSGHFKSFTISEVSFENHDFVINPLKLPQKSMTDETQIPLF